MKDGASVAHVRTRNRHWRMMEGTEVTMRGGYVTPQGNEDQGVLDFVAWKTWLGIPADKRERYLNSAGCRTCKVTSFADGWTIDKTRFSIVIRGRCARCGRSISRVIASGVY